MLVTVGLGRHIWGKIERQCHKENQNEKTTIPVGGIAPIGLGLRPTTAATTAATSGRGRPDRNYQCLRWNLS
jgi:hypothetical protein